MIVKDKFELVYKAGGDIYNLVPLSTSTLKAYQLSKEDFQHLLVLVKTFSRIKKHPASKLIEDNADSLTVVNLPTYPLPGFVTTKGIGVVNLSVIPVKLLTDYSPSDIFALFLYVLALRSFIMRKPFKTGTESNVAGMIFSIFMKLFGKRAGLIGSFKHLIPKLQFLIYLYVEVSMMGLAQTDQLIKKIGSIVYIDPAELKLDYNFKSTSEFLKSINDNNIIPISENKFSSMIISTGGIASLPMFEDLSRFYATILACGVPNSQFSYFWAKINTNLFGKLTENGLRSLSRSI